MMLSFLTIAPLLGAVILFFTDKTNKSFVKNFSLFWSLLVFYLTIFLLILFDPTSTQFQLIEEISWLSFSNMNVTLGIDGLSLFMILLTGFLIPICVMLSWNPSIGNKAKEYNIAFFVLESILFGVFTSLDIMLFYLLFEAVLIPMYIVIGVYGSRERKIRASYLLFLYTLVSSIFMFVAILYIYFKTGTTDYQLLKNIQLDLYAERLC
jgi:NADH:ubiquinone oxidoreductase subunit 4 (subunit M)